MEGSEVESLLSHCLLCPRACGANRVIGERGVCGADATVRIARAALHFWEEPPISGEKGSGTVFFSNCPLQCAYCQNAPIARGSVGTDVSVRRLAQIFLELQEQGALNINLVTATHYVPHVLQALSIARVAGLAIPVVYNTSGYETSQTLQLLDGIVDTYLTDFRYVSTSIAQKYSHAPDYPAVAQEALASMFAQNANIIVRILLLPTHLDEAKAAVLYLHKTYGSRIRLSLMNQYTPVGTHPAYPELNRRVTLEEYEELLDFADSLGCDDYFWQEADTAQESFIPDFESLTGVLGPEL